MILPRPNSSRAQKALTTAGPNLRGHARLTIPGTKLIQFGDRNYSPVRAGWLQPDPSGQTPGYVYAGDDPINLADLSGLSTGGFIRACVKGAVTGAAVGIVASGGTLSGEAAGAGCAGGVVIYDISQVSETAGQVGELVSGAKDIVDEFSSLFS